MLYIRVVIISFISIKTNLQLPEYIWTEQQHGTFDENWSQTNWLLDHDLYLPVLESTKFEVSKEFIRDGVTIVFNCKCEIVFPGNLLRISIVKMDTGTYLINMVPTPVNTNTNTVFLFYLLNLFIFLLPHSQGSISTHIQGSTMCSFLCCTNLIYPFMFYSHELATLTIHF